jgi:hypothetical protein
MGKLPYKSLREIPPFIRVFPRGSPLQLQEINTTLESPGLGNCINQRIGKLPGLGIFAQPSSQELEILYNQLPYLQTMLTR